MTAYSYLLDRAGQNRPDVLQREDGLLCSLVASDPDAQAAQAWVAAGNVPSPAIVTVTGNQWAFALSDMGLAAAWRVGKAKSKDSDQTRLELIARDTPLVVSDPLLIRVAVNAGADANGSPLVSVPAVFLHAQGMPT